MGLRLTDQGRSNCAEKSFLERGAGVIQKSPKRVSEDRSFPPEWMMTKPARFGKLVLHERWIKKSVSDRWLVFDDGAGGGWNLTPAPNCILNYWAQPSSRFYFLDDLEGVVR
jgi:hypothetical protein